METEMTNELKVKFFGNYIGQTVVGHETDKCSFRLTEISLTDCEVGIFGDWSGGTHPQQSCNDLIGIDAVWLNLKSLASITDEDAIELATLLGWTEPHEFKNLFLGFNKCKPTGGLQIDFFRSRGYALDWMGISVERQVNSGWVKLITDNRTNP